MELLADRKSLKNLVDSASIGEIALPMFQRNFVWSREDIAELLRSLLRGYYIGTFLLLRVDPDSPPFSFRSLQGVDLDQTSLRPQWLILDGQQRLTSLHYAMHAPNQPVKNATHPYRFFIRLDALIDGDDEELVESYRASECRHWEDRKNQFADRFLPLTELPNWHDWKEQYSDWLGDTGQTETRDLYRGSWRRAWRETVEANLLNYMIPYIELPQIDESDDEAIAEVCVIFEKINSTGVRLSVFDLLTARLYRHGIDLHHLWESALEENWHLRDFAKDRSDQYGVFLLRTLALLRRQEVRSKRLINLSAEDFEEDWRRAVTAVEDALKRLTSTADGGFGVFDQKWQPYSTLLPVLAVALHHLSGRSGTAHGYADLHAWYWGSVFAERYTGAVETKTYRDAMDLLKRFEDPTFEPVAFREIREQILDNSAFSFRDLARLTSTYRGIMNLIALNGAKDFLHQDSIEFHELEDHHVFPRAHLRDELNLSGGKEVNTIANRTLLTSSTNRAISRRSPSDYVSELIPEPHRRTILSSHFIDQDAEEAMLRDDYETFITHRDRALVRAVRDRLIALRSPRDQGNNATTT